MKNSLKRRALPTRRLPKMRREAGKNIKRKFGEGDAFAHICGSGSAIAVTKQKSVGQATAICEGRGHSYALVDERSAGSACAISNYGARVEAIVSQDATGDANAQSMGSGRCRAHVMPGASAHVVSQTHGKGHALASASSKGNLSLDCRGRGSCHAHQHGPDELAILHEGPQDIVLTNRFRGPVMVHINQTGEIHIFFTGISRQVTTAEAGELLIEPAGRPHRSPDC